MGLVVRRRSWIVCPGQAGFSWLVMDYREWFRLARHARGQRFESSTPHPVAPTLRLGATASTARSDSHLGWCEPPDGAADTGNPLSEPPMRCLASAPAALGAIIASI